MTRSAVLVVDVQTGLVTGAYREAEVLASIARTIAHVRAENGVVVFIQHCHARYRPLMKGDPGWEVHAALDPRAGDLCVEKEASDSFYETALQSLLEAREVGHVYVTGLQTEFCVDATCRAALSRGFEVTLVSDAHTTGDSHMPAADIVRHHNEILGNLAHPARSIRVLSSEALGAV